MAKIKIKDLQEGKILASDVRDQNGMLILSQGREITGKHIHIFKAWGIPEVDIERVAEEEITAPHAENIAKNLPDNVRGEVDELFRYVDVRHPAMAELMELCILRKMESY